MSTLLDFLVQGKFAQAEDFMNEEEDGMGGMGGGMEGVSPIQDINSIEDLVQQIPLDGLDDEQLASLASESPEAQDEADKREEEEQGEEGVTNEELAEKLSQANDFLGRIFAHAFHDELNKIAQAEDAGVAEKKKDKADTCKEKDARSKVVDALSVIQGRVNNG